MDNLNGHPRAVYATAASVGAGNTIVDLRPAIGKFWKVLACSAYHTAGANRNAGWYVTDPENPGGLSLSGTISLPTTSRLVLGAVAAAEVPFSFESWWATEGHYFTFLWTAVGAAENGYIKAEVIEYSGTGKLA